MLMQEWFKSEVFQGILKSHLDLRLGGQMMKFRRRQMAQRIGASRAKKLEKFGKFIEDSIQAAHRGG